MSRPASNPGKAAGALTRAIEKEGGKFIRSGNKVFILLEGKRIEISPEFGNHAYAALQIKHSGIGTAEYTGRAICQRVAVAASERAKNTHLAKFSYLSKDKARLYVPVDNGKLLQVTPGDINLVTNGDNSDSVWLEHPKDNPFKFLLHCDVRRALDRFEQLCVISQSCASEHAWFVAMHEGLLPYVRDFTTARMIVEHLGPSQHGKTTGAERHTKLHGLGDVLGDVTPAYFRNNCDGLGLAVLDNKEHDDQTRELIQLLLFAATGAQNGRSMQDGGAREMKDRPVVALTSIEGVYKRELQKRIVYIPYGVRLSKRHGDRDHIENEVMEHRDEMVTGICHVLKRFMLQDAEAIRLRLDQLPPNTFAEFSGYIRLVAGLLYAYATETGRPATWAETIISNWFQTLGSATESEGDELETHVASLLELYEAVREKSQQIEVTPQHRMLLGCFERKENYQYGNGTGTLYITASGKLLNAMTLNRIGYNALPKTSQAMGRRLDQAKWSSLSVLKESDDPRLKRKSNQRRIGIFRPSEPDHPTEPPLLDDTPLSGFSTA